MPDRTLTFGDPVVDFELRGTDDRSYNSAEARKAGVLLFAICKQGCGTCQYTYPFLQRFHEAYSGSGFEVWGVVQETPEETREFAARFGAAFPQLPDLDLEVSMAYGLTHVPGIYLVDESDRILRHAPAFVAAELNAMAELVAERTGKPYRPVVRDEDDAPALRPG